MSIITDFRNMNKSQSAPPAPGLLIKGEDGKEYVLPQIAAAAIAPSIVSQIATSAASMVVGMIAHALAQVVGHKLVPITPAEPPAEAAPPPMAQMGKAMGVPVMRQDGTPL